MNVTINTDASVMQNHFAGYAFWIVCDMGKIQKAGKIKDKVLGSTQAEMMCIANALHTLKNSRFNGIKKVIINTDSKGCISALEDAVNFRKTVLNGSEECLLTMIEICFINNISIRKIKEVFHFRHVKGHSGKKDSRSFVNDWCDKESRKYSNLRYHGGK